MEAKARLSDYGRSLDGQLRLTFSVEASAEIIDKLTDKELRLKVVQWKEGRSLNANAYFHKLCQLMANVLRSTLTEVKNQMIIDYGQLQYREDGSLDYSIKKDGFDYLRCETTHYMPTNRTEVLGKAGVHRIYLIKRGSHTYNTQEMSVLIDGTVAEAKELGIETMTPEELGRLKEAWNQSSQKT